MFFSPADEMEYDSALIYLSVNSTYLVSLESRSSRISIVPMIGAAIVFDNATAADTIISVKERVFALNSKLHVRRQRLMYCLGPHGMEALADDQTLGFAGVAQDGTAKLDMLLEPLTSAEMDQLVLCVA